MKLFFTALLLLSASVIPADEIFNSNILGMKLDQIASKDAADTDYYLIVSEKNGFISEQLFQKDLLIFDRNILRNNDLTSIETKRDGEFKKEKLKNGFLISEEVQRDGQQPERSEYIYNSGRLESCTFFVNDIPLYVQRYYYTTEGRLLEVNLDYTDERSANAAFSFSEGLLTYYSSTVGGRNIYIKFDKHGVVFSDTTESGSQTETREYGKLENGNSFELIKNKLTGESRYLQFNDDQIISSLTKDADERLIEETSWKYQNDLISEMRIKKIESVEVFLFVYNTDGELIRETYRKNGNIVQITEYMSEYDYTEKLYRNGEAVLEIKYKDGVRYLTEQLQE